MTRADHKLRIGAMGDLHFTRTPESQRAVRELLAAASDRCDVLLLAGDLTDRGLPEEAAGLAQEIQAAVRVPTIAVLGNHDVEAGAEEEVTRILRDAGVRLLDGEACEMDGVGFAGAKGFAGGFGRGSLEPWGEPVLKLFVREAVEESLKLESALARLRTRYRIALLHYAPIRDTVLGEPAEIFAFLGSSRLEEPLGRFRVTAAFHGHAHRGSPTGTASRGTPVYNVSVQVLARVYPDRTPLHVLELDLSDGGDDGGRPDAS